MHFGYLCKLFLLVFRGRIWAIWLVSLEIIKKKGREKCKTVLINCYTCACTVITWYLCIEVLFGMLINMWFGMHLAVFLVERFISPNLANCFSVIFHILNTVVQIIDALLTHSDCGFVVLGMDDIYPRKYSNLMVELFHWFWKIKCIAQIQNNHFF